MKNLFLCVLFFIPFAAHSQTHAEAAERLKNKGLSELMAYSLLNDLITAAGPRLSGSEGYEKAVRWGTEALKAAGADSVWVEPVMIPHWVRGDIENAEVTSGGSTIELSICALGGSIGTPREGITGEVIEVRSFDDVKKLGEKGRGAIIFFNRPFDATKVNTGEAYGGAVNQRTSGAVEAAKIGAAAVLVRSMTNAVDDEPHTGAMRYEDSIRKIPAAAVSTADANMLSSMLKKGKKCTATIRLSAKTLQDRSSYNVIGQITGREFPNEIILVGGHLDSWDKGTGAHDDGSGIAHSIETIRLIASSGLRPKRTIRVVLYANEENGLRGGKAYAARSAMRTEKHLAAIESDAGGFLPRGFGVSTDSIRFEKIRAYASLLEMVGAEKIRRGGGGADISTLEPFGTVMIGLNPESQRYFDYHHSNHDTIDKVHLLGNWNWSNRHFYPQLGTCPRRDVDLRVHIFTAVTDRLYFFKRFTAPNTFQRDESNRTEVQFHSQSIPCLGNRPATFTKFLNPSVTFQTLEIHFERNKHDEIEIFITLKPPLKRR